MNYRILLLAPLAAVVLSVSANSSRMPHGWYDFRAPRTDAKAGKDWMDAYQVGLDPSAGGPPTLTVRSVRPLTPGPISAASAYQSVLGYAGKRVRFSGELKAAGVHGWAGLYLGEGFGHLADVAAAGTHGDKPLPMGSSVQPDGGWHTASVVMDVPAEATHLGFGLGLIGEGQVWVRNLRFDVVGPEVAPTTTRIGVDLEQARRFYAENRALAAKLPPAPLKNVALD